MKYNWQLECTSHYQAQTLSGTERISDTDSVGELKDVMWNLDVCLEKDRIVPIGHNIGCILGITLCMSEKDVYSALLSEMCCSSVRSIWSKEYSESTILVLYCLEHVPCVQCDL